MARKPTPVKLITDSERPEHLVEQRKIQAVRGMLVAQAEQLGLPSRFDAVMNVTAPSVHITDTLTGRSVDVALCDIYGVCKTLQALFGEESPHGQD